MSDMLINTSAAGIKRGKMLWGAMPLPQGAKLLGTVRRAEDQGEEALILLPTGVTVGGNAGMLRNLPPQYTCLRCNHVWIPRSAKSPHNCPACNSPYWDKPRK